MLNYLKFPSDSVVFDENEEMLVQIVGNLPFNISTPLLLLFLRSIYNKKFQSTIKKDKKITDLSTVTNETRLQALSFNKSLFSHEIEMYLMFQKEFADRIIGRVGQKEFGRLAVISQLVTKPQIVANLDAECFVPKPKVSASVVKFIERKDRPFTKLGIFIFNIFEFKDIEMFSELLFNGRRKMIGTTLK